MTKIEHTSRAADEDQYAKREIITGWLVYLETHDNGGPTAIETNLRLSETGNLDNYLSIRLGGVGTNEVQTVTSNDLIARLSTIAIALGNHCRVRVEYCPRTDGLYELTDITLLP